MKSVTVLSTGRELLYGSTADTNSSFISGKLFPMNLKVRMHLVVGDDVDELEHAFRYALSGSDIIIVTGGLGPTDDDNTIAALRRIFNFSVIIDEKSKEKMEKFFTGMGMRMSEADLKMAEVPAGAAVLFNERGLAPGFILQNEKRVIIAMPGVPTEMTWMMEEHVIPFLREECGALERDSAIIRVIGMKESDINAIINSMDINLTGIEWGITAKEGIATVTFVRTENTPLDAAVIISDTRRLFGDRFLDPMFERPEQEVVYLMREKGLTLAAAESCTGGLFSKRITDVPGASDVFIGCVVAYNNSVKQSELGVSEHRLIRFGAVSREVAEDMAAGVRERLRADIGVSITGIAGPGGGTDTKPVGTVCFGLANSSETKTYVRHISGDRERVRMFASLIAIEYLRGYLK